MVVNWAVHSAVLMVVATAGPLGSLAAEMRVDAMAVPKVGQKVGTLVSSWAVHSAVPSGVGWVASWAERSALR